MRIERAVNYVTALGPGKRLCVWVNGCSRRCIGCVSQRLQRIDESTEVDIDEYFFGYNLTAIDGVTISGGEPFDQCKELNRLVKYFKKHGIEDILVYTGFTIEELRRRCDKDVDEILKNISVLIDGEYIKELDFGEGNLKGSDNQRILYLNEGVKERYTAYLKAERGMQEMVLGNTMLAVGIPSEEYIQSFNDKKK